MKNDLEMLLTKCISDLERERQNWIELANRIGDGLIVVDSGGQIQFINKSAASMLKRDESELVGKPFGFPLLNGEVSVVNLLARDGSILIAEIRCTPTQWNEAPAWVILMRDVTEVTRIRGQIEGLNARLSTQVKDLEQFSYSLAHDLRAPLRAIIGFVEVINEELRVNNINGAKHNLNRICQRSVFMESLIEGMLRFARSTIHPIELRIVDLNQLIKTVLSSMAETSPQVQKIVVVDRLPVVKGDTLLLRQVFTNLISNALKYSSQVSDPQVRIFASPPESAVRVSISDNGVGFDQACADRIFDIFTRLEPKKNDGVGVGLSIVKNIMIRHGGKVWAEGRSGRGATFHLEFPDHSPSSLNHDLP